MKSLSSSGPGHCPFTAETRVRSPLGMLIKDKFFPIVTVILGACLEYYNYMLLTFMLKYDGFLLNFFASNSHSSAMLAGYQFLLLTALSRPFGALFFGWIGDKYGRKQALFWSIILMSFSSFLLTVSPTYQQIGSYALLFLFFCRVMQIISASGESNGVAIFLIEHVGHSRAGFASGVAFSATILGAGLANYAAYVISTLDVTWRYAFLIGGVVSAIGMIIRFKIIETHTSGNSSTSVTSTGSWLLYTCIILVSAATSAGFYYTAVFLSGHWQRSLSIISYNKINYLNSELIFLYAFLLLLSGILSDYISLFKLMKSGAYTLLLITPITYSLITSSPHSRYIMPLLILSFAALSLLSGPLHSFLYRFFPPHMRYRTVSLCYSIASATIGTGTIFASEYLTQYNNQLGWIWIWCVFAAALLSLYQAEKIWKTYHCNDV